MISSVIPNPSCGSLKPFSSSSSFSSSAAASIALCASPSIRVGPLSRPRSFSIASSSRSGIFHPRGFGAGFPSLNRRISLDQSTVTFAASHEESKHSEEVEKEKEELKSQAEESEEAWKQTLASFREQAVKMQSVSKEAYEIYSKKAMVILKDTSEQLKVQAEKAKIELTEAAREISVEGKEYISTAAEKSPEPVKEVVETFSSAADDFNDVSKLRDFHLGIPYGLLLSVVGFISFMVTGSLTAIRFGVILGGSLLALSVASLRSYRRGKRSVLLLKGQTVIALMLFFREICLLAQRLSFPTFVTTSVSGAMVAFFFSRIIIDSKNRKRLDLEPGAEN